MAGPLPHPHHVTPVLPNPESTEKMSVSAL